MLTLEYLIESAADAHRNGRDNGEKLWLDMATAMLHENMPFDSARAAAKKKMQELLNQNAPANG